MQQWKVRLFPLFQILNTLFNSHDNFLRNHAALSFYLTFDLENIMWETIASSVAKILIQKALYLLEKLKQTNNTKAIGDEYGYLMTGRLIFLLRYL